MAHTFIRSHLAPHKNAREKSHAAAQFTIPSRVESLIKMNVWEHKISINVGALWARSQQLYTES